MQMLVRPLSEADVEAARVVQVEAFAAHDRELGEPAVELTEERARRQRARIGHFLCHDPGGAWAAEVDGRLVGVALAQRRESLWGLSLLVVQPGLQARGVGRRLLDAALGYADPGGPAVILSSSDPRAMHRYASAGFALHPQVRARGAVDSARLAAPSRRVRPGTAADRDLASDVDRVVRGAARGPDHVLLGELGEMFVVDDTAGRGYAYLMRERVETIVANDEETASALLWQCLNRAAELGTAPAVEHVNAGQQWAVRVMVAAGLSIAPSGPAFWRGRPPPAAYLPSGPYL